MPAIRGYACSIAASQKNRRKPAKCGITAAEKTPQLVARIGGAVSRRQRALSRRGSARLQFGFDETRRIGDGADCSEQIWCPCTCPSTST